MRRLLTLLVLAALAALASQAAVTPAHAGGPTSVLITEPGSGNATALYHSETGYADLDRLLAGTVPLRDQPTDLGTRMVHLTWMAHDVSPWRTQRLYVHADGGPVLETYDLTDGTPSWARVTEAKAVAHLVDQLLRPGVEPDLAAVEAAEAAGSSTPTPPAAAERVVTETAWWSLAGWRWLVLGLLVGAGAVLLARRARPAARRTPLVDLEPGAEVLTR